MDPVKFGSFLRSLRKEKGLTQEQLAEKFGVTNRSVSRWETGTNLPDLDMIISLSDFYEVDVRELLDGERKKDAGQVTEQNKETFSSGENEALVKAAEYGSARMNKTWKKRLVIAVLSVLSVLIAICLFVMLKPVYVDHGSSEIHDAAQIDLAAEAVKADISRLWGCKLFSLNYAGDERSLWELEKVNKTDAENDYSDCIVLDSFFLRAPMKGGRQWGQRLTYTWSWIVVKTHDGEWIVFDRGYC